jgi:hypothetical protein
MSSVLGELGGGCLFYEGQLGDGRDAGVSKRYAVLAQSGRVQARTRYSSV